jgi:hypothetical protein
MLTTEPEICGPFLFFMITITLVFVRAQDVVELIVTINPHDIVKYAGSDG